LPDELGTDPFPPVIGVSSNDEKVTNAIDVRIEILKIKRKTLLTEVTAFVAFLQSSKNVLK